MRQPAGDHIKQFFDSPKPAGDQQIEKLYKFQLFHFRDRKNETRERDGNDWTI